MRRRAEDARSSAVVRHPRFYPHTARRVGLFKSNAPYPITSRRILARHLRELCLFSLPGTSRSVAVGPYYNFARTNFHVPHLTASEKSQRNERQYPPAVHGNRRAPDQIRVRWGRRRVALSCSRALKEIVEAPDTAACEGVDGADIVAGSIGAPQRDGADGRRTAGLPRVVRGRPFREIDGLCAQLSPVASTTARSSSNRQGAGASYLRKPRPAGAPGTCRRSWPLTAARLRRSA
jgi:hypothetical protein